MKRSGTLVLLFLFGTFVYSQVDTGSASVRLMFYNVENLFDTYDDPVKDDDEFLPAGLRRWNQTRYKKKLNSIYKTITAAGEWSPPALVGLCEIENRKVLEDLVLGTYLSNYRYGIIHEESPDERGIDVALIFRKDIVHILDYRTWIPAAKKADFKSRSVLYVKCEIFHDTLHLIINHWPSRRGGVLAGESLRNDIALMVRAAADSLITKSSGNSKIIITGDFNCTPDDPVIKTLIEPGHYLVNLTSDNSSIPGTYRYTGIWEQLDQIIVSEPLLSCAKGLYTGHQKFAIYKPDFLLRNDINYPGLTTYPTYRGYRYQGGFSDHLPVLLDLFVR